MDIHNLLKIALYEQDGQLDVAQRTGGLAQGRGRRARSGAAQQTGTDHAHEQTDQHMLAHVPGKQIADAGCEALEPGVGRREQTDKHEQEGSGEQGPAQNGSQTLAPGAAGAGQRGGVA